MGSLNWTEVEKSAKAGEARKGGGFRLFLQSGEPAELRFIGLGNNEPYIYKRHFDGKTKKYVNCAEDHAKDGEHEGCVACMIARSMRGKDARLKSPQRLYAVSVFDPRKTHFVEKLEGNDRYQPCTDDETCKWCRRKVDRKINGVRHWSMAEGVIMQLRTFERDVLGKQCARDKGRIRVTGYQCPTCEDELEPDGDAGEEMRCRNCEKEQGKKPILVVPKEIISCKTCGTKGKRLTLADAWVTVTKTGQKKNTTYNFNVGEIEPFDAQSFIDEFPEQFKDVKKIKPIKFEGHPDFEPPSAAEMAALLGVRNPFGKSKDADDDEDEDDEDDDDVKFKKRRAAKDEDDDEEDDPPAKKKRRPVDDDEDDDEDEQPRKKKKRPVDDDDEDDNDDIFD